MPRYKVPLISAKARKILRANPSVVGFSETLNPKIVRGKPTARQAIRVYVEKKLPKKSVPKNNLIPPRIDGVATDVVAIGKLEPTAVAPIPIPPPPNRQRFRPVLGGASGIHTGGTAGTLGYFMREKKNPRSGSPNKPQWYALSCAHVLHPPLGSVQNETIQPSPNPNDGGQVPADWIGREFLYTYDGIDAALSKIDVGAKAEIIGLPTPTSTAIAQKSMTVAKSGRTTGVTYGKVIDDGAEFNFQHWGTAPGKVRFRDVIIVQNKHHLFSDGGDSGSLVIDPADETVIGIVFGGDRSLTPKSTLIAPIDRILRAFPAQMLVKKGETYP
jgi:hypothetical protein